MAVVRNKERADAVIRFISHLTVGEDSDAPFVLRPFQEEFIRAVYEPMDEETQRRKVRRAILSMAKKNGKTELAAALLLAHLVGPESTPGGHIFSAATEKTQAAIVFDAAKRMVEADPRLQALIDVVPSRYTMSVRSSNHRGRGSRYKALSAEDGSKHGYKPSFVIYDELGEAPNDKLFNVLSKSMIARKEPLLLAISTQNHDPQHHFSVLIDYALRGDDPTVVCQIHQADEGCDLLDEEQWYKACPALGDFLDLDGFRAEAQEAARLPTKEADFRRYCLNQRVSTNTSLIKSADWKACGPQLTDPLTWVESDTFQFEPGEGIYLGLDLSAKTDLTALVAVSAEDGSRVKSWFWKPEDEIRSHSERDRFRYDVFLKNGWLHTTPGRSIDPLAVAMKIAELYGKYEIRGIAYDRHRIDTLLQNFDRVGLDAQEGQGWGVRLVPWGQGFTSMTIGVEALEEAVLQEELRHDGNPVLTFCMLNAVAISDPAGNRKLDKTKARFRIDGAVALAMALGLKAQDRLEGEPTSVFDDPNFQGLTVI